SSFLRLHVFAAVGALSILAAGLAALALLDAGCAAPSEHAGDCDAFQCGCATDSDCTDGRRCDKGSAKCVQCVEDGDCPAGAVCGADHGCGRGCTAAHGCGDAGVCETDASVCVECNTDADCGEPARPRCD